MTFQAVVFDLFGTLVDTFTDEEYFRVIGGIAEIVGAPKDEFIAYWSGTVDERMVGQFPTLDGDIAHACERIGVHPDAARITRAVEVRVEMTRRALVPRDDALTTLSALRTRGYRLGLVSDCTHEVPLLWPDTPFAGLMDEAVFSCTAKVKKPNPAIYLQACERLGVAPQHCLYVGDDSSRELPGARRVGMHPVLIRVPHEDIGRWNREEAQGWSGPTVSALGQVTALLE